jgi:lipopolysaccharide biosynthesis glycosyltransferase
MNYSEDYMIWLDGDVVFKKDVYQDFPKSLVENNFLACQLEHSRDNHIESGILIFNGHHENTQKFAKQFKTFYNIEHLLTMGEPYDGFVIYKTLAHLKLPFTDLNKQYGRGGIQSDPNETFLHPAIKSRFTHNIGPTGKAQYDS